MNLHYPEHTHTHLSGNTCRVQLQGQLATIFDNTHWISKLSRRPIKVSKSSQERRSPFMSAHGKGFETAMKALESSSRLPKLVVFDLGTQTHTFALYDPFALWPSWYYTWWLWPCRLHLVALLVSSTCDACQVCFESTACVQGLLRKHHSFSEVCCEGTISHAI